MTVSLIVAASDNDVIGFQGSIPWNIPEDLRRFRNLTWGKSIVVGHNTQASIGELLPGRQTYIVLRGGYSTTEALTLAGPDCFVIGGGKIYAEALPYVQRIYLTRVHLNRVGDTFMPTNWLNEFLEVWRQEHDLFTYINYERA